jgi:predicted PurR-regulated permease PerM
MLQPVVLWVQKLVKKRLFAIIIVIVSFTVILFLIAYITFPYLLAELKSLIKRLPTIINDLEELVNNFAARLDFLPVDYQPTIDNLGVLLERYLVDLSKLPEQILSSIFAYISIILIVPMIIIFFLLDYEKILCSLRDYLIEHGRIRFKNYLAELNQVITSYLRGTLLVMTIMVVSSTIIFLILDVDFAIFFAIIIAVTNIIPYLGPYIGAAFPIIYSLITVSPGKALIVGICVSIIQTIESNFLTPYINSKKINTHPILVIFFLILFGKIFGIIGMIISTPVLAILIITYKYYMPFKKKTV